MILIGSSAIKHYFPDFPREPKDKDYIIFEYQKFDIVPQLHNQKIEYFKNKVISDLYTDIRKEQVIDINHLYTLKISHSFWDLPNGSWEKHLWDIQWLKEKGCVFDVNLFYKLYTHWETVHGKVKRSNLDMSADKFFDNAITCPIEHDTLHAYLIEHFYFNQDKPTYTKMLADNAEVLTDENKFNQLTEQEKLNVSMEEVMVMAYERYSNLYYKHAFNKMLKKFILQHAPIWQALHIIQNHKQLLTNIPFNYIEHLNKFL